MYRIYLRLQPKASAKELFDVLSTYKLRDEQVRFHYIQWQHTVLLLTRSKMDVNKLVKHFTKNKRLRSVAVSW